MQDVSNLSELELLQMKNEIEMKLASSSNKMSDQERLIESANNFNQICESLNAGVRMELMKHNTEEKVLLKLVDTEDDEILVKHYSELSDLEAMLKIINLHTKYIELYQMYEDLSEFKIVKFNESHVSINFLYKNIDFSIDEESKQISIKARIIVDHGKSDHFFRVGDFALNVLNRENANLEFELVRRMTTSSINLINLVIDKVCEDLFDKIESMGF